MVYLFYPEPGWKLSEPGWKLSETGWKLSETGWKQEFAIFITKVKSTVCIENKFTVGGD